MCGVDLEKILKKLQLAFCILFFFEFLFLFIFVQSTIIVWAGIDECIFSPHLAQTRAR